MVDRIVDNRGGVCNQCETEYQSLAQHWSMSQSCDYPPLSEHQREIVRGLMLGDGSLDSNELAYSGVPRCENITSSGSQKNWAGLPAG